MLTTFEEGKPLDMLTPAEFTDALSPLVESTRKNRPPIKIVQTSVLTTDATGAFGETAVYRVPAGFRADVERLVCSGAGSTPAVPLTAGFISFSRNSILSPAEIWFPRAAGGWVAPASYEGGDAAPALRQNEVLVAYGQGLTANRAYSIVISLRVWDTYIVEDPGANPDAPTTNES